MEVNMNPLCLKLTISPFCGVHLFENSAVPAGATNLTPFGLLNTNKREKEKEKRKKRKITRKRERERERERERDVIIQFTFPLMHSNRSDDLRFRVSEFLRNN